MHDISRREALNRGAIAAAGLTTLGGLGQVVAADDEYDILDDNYGTVDSDWDDFEDNHAEAELSLEIQSPNGSSHIYDYKSPRIVSFAGALDDNSSDWRYRLGRPTLEITFSPWNSSSDEAGMTIVENATIYEETGSDYIGDAITSAIEQAISYFIGFSIPVPDLAEDADAIPPERESLKYDFPSIGTEGAGATNPIIGFDRHVSDLDETVFWDMEVSLRVGVIRTYCDMSCYTETVHTMECEETVPLYFRPD